MWRVWIEIPMMYRCRSMLASPSVWRVWIEIPIVIPPISKVKVTLRVEGVD